MKAEIHNRGRGPEIKGTRITVYDLIDYRGKYATEWIANLYNLTVKQVEVAYAYIDAHRDEVMAEYDKMVARAKQGNSPRVRAMKAESHKILLARLEELKLQNREKAHA